MQIERSVEHNLRKLKMRKKLYFRYLFSILWTVIVLYLSLAHFKTDGLPKFRFPHLDKIVHFAMYFIYTFFLLLESKHYNKLKTKIIIVLYAISFGILMELLQDRLFEYRSGDIYDAIFNSLGAITMAVIFSKIRKVIYSIGLFNKK